MVNKAIASYIASILIHEGFAKQEGRFELKFNDFKYLNSHGKDQKLIVFAI